MNGISPYRILQSPELDDAALVVCWDEDAGDIGQTVYRYLHKTLDTRLFAEIEPGDFFPLSGVTVDNNVAQFPESRFYFNRERKLVVFHSSLPRFEWYKFIESIMDVAQKICRVREIYTVGGMVTVAAHTLPRLLMATLNNGKSKMELNHYDIILNMDYETPPGQRPTLSSYLIWAAMRRNVPGISLWVPVPFYMVSVNDIRASRRMMDFLDKRLNLGIEFSDLDGVLAAQNKILGRVTDEYPELSDMFRKLETNIALTETESARLIEVIEKYLKYESIN